MRLVSTIVAAICSLLLILTAIFWVRSYWYYEGIVRHYDTEPAPADASLNGRTVEQDVTAGTAGLLSAKGQLAWATIANPLPGPGWETWSHPGHKPLESGTMSLMAEPARQSGFSLGSGKTKAPLRDPNGIEWRLPYRYVGVPYWFIGLLLAIHPIRWMSNYRLMLRREREGRCLQCGHDLKGQSSGRCPECNALIDDDNADRDEASGNNG